MNAPGVLGPILLAAAAPEISDVPVSYPPPVVLTRTDDGTHLRGDWEPPEAVGLVFTDAWEESFDTMVGALAPRVPVIVLLEEGLSMEDVERHLDILDDDVRSNVWNTGISVETMWIRDWGPLYIRDPDGAVRWLDTAYTDSRPLDKDGLRELMKSVDPQRHGRRWSSLEFDGGAIASSGRGLCVGTVEFFEQVGLEDNRSLKQFMRKVGCPHLVLVPALAQEETKHVDVMLQFTEPGVVAIASYNPVDAPYDAVRTDIAAETIAQAADLFDIPLEIRRVPSPAPNHTLYPAYVNFLRVSDVILAPSFASVPDRSEHVALMALRQSVADPNIELVTVDAEEMLRLGGGVHCVTKEFALPVAGAAQ